MEFEFEQLRELPDWIIQARPRIAQIRREFKREKVSDSTKKEYEKVAARYFDKNTGALIAPVISTGTKSDYVIKAAGAYFLKERVSQALNAADKIWKDKKLTEGVRWSLWKEAVAEVEKRAKSVNDWQEKDWWVPYILAREDGSMRKENHKKTSATDRQLEQFWKVIKDDAKYSMHFLAMEFTGCRPDEFLDGVQMWLGRNSAGEIGIKCKIIKRAKQRTVGSGGKQHGLPDSVFFVAVPDRNTPQPVKDRYNRVIEALKQHQEARLDLKVDATDASTAGRLITKSFCKASEKAGLNISPCSLRHRFSANAKASALERHPSNPKQAAIEVADMMGQASTETQLRYGRTNRRGGSVALVRIDRVRTPLAEIRCARSSHSPKTKKIAAQAVKTNQLNIKMAPKGGFWT